MGESELERDTGKHVRSHIQKGKKKKSVEWLNNGMKMLNSTVVIHVKALLPKYEEMRQKMKA